MNSGSLARPSVDSTDAERWQAVIQRDRGQDGQFWYSVKTTGVYCRPSCGARLPRPENVAFHLSRDAAETAGFRPCRRCTPTLPSRDQLHAALAERACRIIECAETPPSLEELATELELSPYHFHRLFKRLVGVTPRAYAAAERARRVRLGLGQAGTTVTQAIYQAGFNSNSRFYETVGGTLGMTPSQYRAGGAHASIRFALARCSLGEVLVAASERGLCAILIGDQAEPLLKDLQDRFPRAELIGANATFDATVAAVIGLVEQPARGLDLPLDIQGTAFQQRVWQALRQITPGKTASYADIAERIGAPTAVRAVAGACAANALAIAIPCHRVVRTDGSLSGYRWGVERKRVLLEREQSPDIQIATKG